MYLWSATLLVMDGKVESREGGKDIGPPTQVIADPAATRLYFSTLLSQNTMAMSLFSPTTVRF